MKIAGEAGVLEYVSGRLDLPVETIRDLLEGEIELTPEIADKLEVAFGMSAQFWLNLEAYYRKELALLEKNWQRDNERRERKKARYRSKRK